ncbi:unnamed protein product [Paramecium sonneborni]|uniref:Uncharacterized protein n=1 Tax=Paramecium sonneborni TaxID=65129 RepID=A0A8S1PQM2_9CILI|nr:unnamed protein product [Paramecium sonneborni]
MFKFNYDKQVFELSHFDVFKEILWLRKNQIVYKNVSSRSFLQFYNKLSLRDTSCFIQNENQFKYLNKKDCVLIFMIRFHNHLKF